MYCPGAGIWPSGPGNEAVSGSITALSGPSRPLDGAMMCPDGVLGTAAGQPLETVGGDHSGSKFAEI